MGTGGEEAVFSELAGKNAAANYIAAPYGEAEREYLLTELETARLHASMVEEMLRKIWNTANSRGLDQEWSYLGLMLDHLKSDLRYVEREIEKLRDSS